MIRSDTTPDEELRLEALSDSAILDSENEECFDRILALAVTIFQVPVALIAFIDRRRYWFKSRVGTDHREWPRDPQREPEEFLQNGMVWHHDSGSGGESAAHSLQELQPYRFSASAPIQCPNGQVIGRIIIADASSRDAALPEQCRALNDLASIATREIALRTEAVQQRRPEAQTDHGVSIAQAADHRTTDCHLLFHRSPLPMWVINGETLRFTSSNDASLAKFGWSREEMVGRALADLINEGGAPPWATNRQVPPPSTSVLRVLTKDHRTIENEIHCQIFTEHERPALLVILIDVTERRMVETALTNSREALRRVLLQRTTTLDALPVNVALLDETGRIIFVNRTWRNFAEAGHFPDAEQMVGGNYVQICEQNEYLYGGRSADLVEGVKSVLAGRLPIYELESPFQTARGVLWFRTMIAPVSVAPKLDGAVVLHIDITDAKHADDAIRSAHAAAAAANHLKSQFLANTSHELRTPLNAIIGFSELIKLQAFGCVEEKYLEYIDYIHASGHHLLEIINDLLDLSKIEAGQMKLRDEEVSIRNLVEECVEYFKIRMEKGKLSHEIDVAADLLLRCDRLRMKQILLNVLSNAVKFTPEGGHIQVIAKPDDTGWIVIEIIDTGVGMDEDGARRALEPFVQVDTPVSGRSEGTGLGLALVNHLVVLHSGTLEIRSVLGAGTTIRLKLPVSRVVSCEGSIRAD